MKVFLAALAWHCPLFLHLLSVPTARATSAKMDYLTASMVRTDPIISRNGPSDHLHTFFGPLKVDPSTTYEDLRNTSQNSGNVEENHSLYWYPTIYRYDAGRKKYFIAEIFHHSSYYVWNTGGTEALPNGFKVIVHGRGITKNGVSAETACTTTLADDGSKTTITKCGKAKAECVDPGAVPSTETDVFSTGGNCKLNPNSKGLNDFFPMTSCAELELSIEFPDCWDGVNLDSTDHTQHVSYEDPTTEKCPTSHPKRIPKVFVFTRILNYPGGYHVFSDGTGNFHADYFSGWKESELKYVLDNCENYSFAPSPDAFCDKQGGGRAGVPTVTNEDNSPERLGTADPKFFTYRDVDKAPSPYAGKKMEHKSEQRIDDKLKALGTVKGGTWRAGIDGNAGYSDGLLDTSSIVSEEIDAISLLPGGHRAQGLPVESITSSSSCSAPTSTTISVISGAESNWNAVFMLGLSGLLSLTFV